jgi:Carboxypeptidase regulatory-like domain
MFLKSPGIALVGLFLLAFSARGGPPALEGVVKDWTGRPIKGADVRIEAKNLSKIVKTDASGHYIFDGLAVGTYKVTLVVNGSVKASIVNANTQLDKPTQLNFDLTTRIASVNSSAVSSPVRSTHMVWVAPDTGTLIGGGRWVEVDNSGYPINNGANAVEKIGRAPRDRGRSVGSVTGCGCENGSFVGLAAARTVRSLWTRTTDDPTSLKFRRASQ